ncbi:MAG: OsmC family protein [Bacteroidia bacterium]|nr:OsmC family protein [Bacteroidia bacterium]
MTSTVKYSGELRTVATHIKSGNSIITDAPTDNHGKGEAFSPTDLLATALGACMLTVMGIYAERSQINIKGTMVEIEKIMGTEPRRVTEIKVKMIFPADLTLDEKQRKSLENTALTCPVAKSLHPDLKQDIEFVYL